MNELVRRAIQLPWLGFLGTTHINVLSLNLELDKLSKAGRTAFQTNGIGYGIKHLAYL